MGWQAEGALRAQVDIGLLVSIERFSDWAVDQLDGVEIVRLRGSDLHWCIVHNFDDYCDGYRSGRQDA